MTYLGYTRKVQNSYNLYGKKDCPINQNSKRQRLFTNNTYYDL